MKMLFSDIEVGEYFTCEGVIYLKVSKRSCEIVFVLTDGKWSNTKDTHTFGKEEIRRYQKCQLLLTST